MPMSVVLLTNLIILSMGIPMTAVMFRPVYLLRNRIRTMREARMGEVIDSLERGGADQALMTELMFLESRSDWPIARQFRQLVLFGVLPPITWLLAAVVENTIY